MRHGMRAGYGAALLVVEADRFRRELRSGLRERAEVVAVAPRLSDRGDVV